jgi:hypothetical protein
LQDSVHFCYHRSGMHVSNIQWLIVGAVIFSLENISPV